MWSQIQKLEGEKEELKAKIKAQNCPRPEPNSQKYPSSERNSRSYPRSRHNSPNYNWPEQNFRNPPTLEQNPVETTRITLGDLPPQTIQGLMAVVPFEGTKEANRKLGDFLREVQIALDTYIPGKVQSQEKVKHGFTSITLKQS